VAPTPRAFLSHASEDKPFVQRLALMLHDNGIDTFFDAWEIGPGDSIRRKIDEGLADCSHFIFILSPTSVRKEWVNLEVDAAFVRKVAEEQKFIPILYGLDLKDVPPLISGMLWLPIDDSLDGAWPLIRELQGIPRKPPVRPFEPPTGDPSVSVPPLPTHPRVEDVFVGRGDELKAMAALLLPAGGRRRPVVVSGMPGVGKSYLVDRFFSQHGDKFPGGYARLALDPENLASAADLRAQLADRLKLPPGDVAALAARLQGPLALLHVESVDSREAGRLAGELAASLPGCALVFSARYCGVGSAAGWGQVEVLPFTDDDALAQLRAELGVDAPHQQDWPELVAALGRLPLALHLAAGHLREGDRPAQFLKRLRAKGLALDYVDPADPVFLQRSRALLTDTFDLSIAVLRRAGGDAWADGLYALGWGAAAGFGESLGAAIAGLDADAFDDMARAAARLSLLERLARGDGTAIRLHPLLAELGRARADREATIARMTNWFCERLPEAAGLEGRWTEVHAETASLLDWLPLVPEEERTGVERAGSWFAINSGPFHAWLRFCEAMLSGNLDDAARSGVLWTLGQVALSAGLPDRALAVANEKQALDKTRGEDRGAALAAGIVADILQARGQLDEALRIRQEEQLPVYERLGDVRSRAVTMGKIADILQARGQLDEALRIRQEEQLPVYERLGDVRELLVGRANLAQLLLTRNNDGDRDEAGTLLCLALAEARRLRIPEAGRIEEFLTRNGLSCD
jgi:tetratricopeptide (TPR) repeat protein